MNESTWRARIDALKLTEQHLLQRERRCSLREAVLLRAVEEGVNARAEKQLLDVIDRELAKLPAPFSTVRALDELGAVAAEMDGMRRALVLEAEDVALERHRLRIWSEQLHAAFASLNARSTELQMEARRLSGLPQASIQLAQHQQRAVALANAQIENLQQRQSALAAGGSHHSRSDSRQDDLGGGGKGDVARSELLARRESALQEREKHVTELFRYVMDQRALVERQLELIGERIQMLAAAPEREQRQPSAADSSPAPFRHPLLGLTNPLGVLTADSQQQPSPHPMDYPRHSGGDDDDDGVDYSHPF